MKKEEEESGILALGPEAKEFLDKLIRCQKRISEEIKDITCSYDDLPTGVKERVRTDLDKAGGILLFGGLLLPKVLREVLGEGNETSTFHGVSRGDKFDELYEDGISLSGNIKADTALAINLLFGLGSQTGLDGMLLLNTVLLIIQRLMTKHLGGQKFLSLLVENELNRQKELWEKLQDEALLAKAREMGSA